MAAKVTIEAGSCGFRTVACATSRDEQWVTFELESNCEKITPTGSRDASSRIARCVSRDSCQRESSLLETARNVLQGCCAGCAVPIGLFKCLQVAAGLTLPKEIRIELSKPECP